MENYLEPLPRNFVVKSNALIEARYRLSLQEAHVILWLLTQIHPADEDFKLHKLDINQFSNMVGLEAKGQYTHLQTVTGNLMRRVLKIYEPKTHDMLQVAWLSSARYQKKKGCVLLRFDPDLKPYLLQLKSHFTKLDIIDTLKLKSIHAIRIFELLSQYIQVGMRKMSVDDLRLYCGIEKHEYIGYGMLKRKVLDTALFEINNKTDYTINYIEIKESRKVIALEWTIKKKNIQQEQNLEKLAIIQKEIRSEALLVEALMEYGFSKIIGKRLIKHHGEHVVKNALKAVNIQIKRSHAKNPKAMLQTAIQEKWHPEIYKKKL